MAQSAQRHQCAQSSTTPTLYFCPLEAEIIGLNEAIIVARIRFWLSRSKNIFDGRPWVYNTYPDWQKQFPFWSVFTVKNIFRRLEELGVLESTQRFNVNRWNKTKWYALDEDVVAELMGNAVVPNAIEMVVAEAAETEVVAMGTEVAIDGEQTALIEGIETAAIEEIDIVPSLSGRSPDKTSKSACAWEPEGGARTHALEVHKPEEQPVVNDLDMAYAEIPEGERKTWYERADRTLEAAGMPDWMRIAPTVKAAAVRMWLGGVTPWLALT